MLGWRGWRIGKGCTRKGSVRYASPGSLAPTWSVAVFQDKNVCELLGERNDRGG